MKHKHKSFARWSRGMDNKFRDKNMKEIDETIDSPIMPLGNDGELQVKLEPHGLLESTILPEDYIFGGTTKMPDVILRPDGQWDNDLPEKELQNKGFETNACTVFGTENCAETLHKVVVGFEKNWSERFTAIMADIDPNAGGYPEKVIESIRKNGNLLEEELPFDETITTPTKFYSPKPMTDEYKEKAKQFVTEYTIMHEWITPVTPASLMAALKRSPVGISVCAWIFDTKTGYYVNPEGLRSNHWVMCYGYVEGKYWKIYDHYNKDKKMLAWDYPFGHAKKYYLAKNPPAVVTQVEGTIDGKPVKKGSIISLAEAFKFVVTQIGYLGYMFARLGKKLFNK